MSFVTQALNGLNMAFNEDLKAMLQAISEKYEIPLSDLYDVAFAASDARKIKVVKLQKRQPKKLNAVVKPKKNSAYLEFTDRNRDRVKNLLIQSEDERTFIGTKGQITIDFGEKGPDFSQITKKMASVWASLSEKEKAEYEEIARNAPPRVKSVKGKAKNAKNNNSQSQSQSETQSEVSETTQSETSETVEEKIPPKKGKQAPPVENKQPVQTLPKKGGPPKKNNRK